MLPKEWALPAPIRNSFSERAGRQRFIVSEDHLLISLHWVPQVNVERRIGVYLWRQPNGSWYSYREPITGEAPVDPLRPDLEHRLLKATLKAYDQQEDQLERQQEQAESPAQYLQVLRETITMQHAIKNLHETLEAIPADLDDSLPQLRDYAYEIRRSYEFLYSFSRNGLEIYQAEQAEVANRRANQLNLIAAFTLPLTALASVFGMSLEIGGTTFFLITALGLVWGWGLWMFLRHN